MMDLILYILAGIGFLGAFLALYGRYRTLPSFFTGPKICRLEAGGCKALFRTKNAALLGIPNSALAVLYYPFLTLGSLLHWPFLFLLIPATLAFLMTLFLGWILIRDHLECRVCWTGHVCNTLIWLFLVFSHK